MNPEEFWWKEDQQVTVVNPTGEDYTFKVHSKEYTVGAGKTATMPGFIAWVYVYGLSTQIAQADGLFNRWNEEEFRQEYYHNLVSGAAEVVQSVQVEEPPLVQVSDEEPAITPEDELPAGGEYYEPTAKNDTVEPMKAEPKAKALRRDKSKV